MAVLAAVCVVIGLAPVALLPALSAAAAEWARLPADLAEALTAGGLRQAARISLVAAALLVAIAALLLWRRSRLRSPQPLAPTWGCGFGRPTARMQYTGSSFADSLVLRFGWVFLPENEGRPAARAASRGTRPSTPACPTRCSTW